MSDQETFIFYLDWVDKLDKLPVEDAYSVIKAITEYKRGVEIHSMSLAAEIAFDFIRSRLDRDYERWEARCAAQEENGRKGGAPKGNQNACKNNPKQPKTTQTTQNNPIQPKTTQTTLHEHEHEYVHVDNPPYSPPKGREVDFERFWKAYPKKVGKRQAERVFKSVKVSVDTLLSAIEVQKKSNQWIEAGGKFIPHPATWLNGERWKDELITEIPNPGSQPKYSNPFLDMLTEEGEHE